MSTQAIQDALIAWFRVNSGLPQAQVYMADQDMPRAARPFITLRFQDSIELGSTDLATVTENPSNPPETPVDITYEGNRRMTVSVRAYSDEANGDSSAQSMLHRLRILLRNDVDAATGFLAAGFAIPSTTRVANLAARDDTAFRGQAEWGLNVGYVETVTQKTTYIEHAELTAELVEADGRVVSETEVEIS